VLEATAGELILVRFSPMNTNKFIEQATDHADYCGSQGEERVFAVSTFGDNLGEGESVEALVTRVCQEVGCGGPRIWLVNGSTLSREGYDAVLSEPPPRHHDVIMGNEQTIQDVEALAERAETLVGLFVPGRERNPAWKRN